MSSFPNPAAADAVPLPPIALPWLATPPPVVAARPAPAAWFDHSDPEQCLTAAIYYEAATEPRAGREAVAQVVLNRARHPAYPKSVCDVVFQGSARRTGCQFTFTCDGSLTRTPAPRLWAEAEIIARDALAGAAVPGLETALNYHADYVRPAWRTGLSRLGQIGAHIFYAPRGSGTATIPVGPMARGTASGSAAFAVWGLRIATVRPGGAVTAIRPIAVDSALSP